ncbi:MAG: hypothetical protein R3F62_01730 [Planctomycetota bacterium]
MSFVVQGYATLGALPVPKGLRARVPGPDDPERFRGMVRGLLERLDPGTECGLLVGSAWGPLSELGPRCERVFRDEPVEDWDPALVAAPALACARERRLQGPVHTIQRGAASFAAALALAGGWAQQPLCVLGADEVTPHVVWARAAYRGLSLNLDAEGGAGLLLGPGPTPLAEGFARVVSPPNPRAWLREWLAAHRTELLLAPPPLPHGLTLLPQSVKTVLSTKWDGEHPASAASAAALAVGLLAGHVPSTVCGLATRPQAVAVAAVTPRGALGVIRLVAPGTPLG